MSSIETIVENASRFHERIFRQVAIIHQAEAPTFVVGAAGLALMS